MGLQHSLRCAGTKVNPHKRLVQAVDELLEALLDVVVIALDAVPCFAVLFPEVVSPHEDVRDSDSAGATVAHIADELNNIVKKRSKVFWGLAVIILEEDIKCP